MVDQPTLRSALDGVTIAIPNWNHEYLLARSVGSALRGLRELREHGVEGEVLVVDDASRDGSMTLLRQFEALYFEDGLRVLALERNGGLPALTRNLALRVASYRYILLLDADNELVWQNVWHFYRAIQQTGAALVYGSLLSAGLGTQSYRMLSNESYQDRILDENYIDSMVLADRMQLADAGGYLDTELMLAREDWEMVLHLSALGRRLIFVPLMMGYYHDMPGSLTNLPGQSALHERQQKWLRRVYNQLGIRKRQPLNTRHLRYHPDIGYL
jgi:glycosyltransferase involved in cell wall biosynthesis